MTSIRTSSMFRLLVVFCALSVAWPDAVVLAQQGPALNAPAGTRVRLLMGKGESPTLEVRSPHEQTRSAVPGTVVTIGPITGVATTVVPGPNGTRLTTCTNPDGSLSRRGLAANAGKSARQRVNRLRAVRECTYRG